MLQAPVLENQGRKFFGGVNAVSLQNALKVQRRASLDSRNRSSPSRSIRQSSFYTNRSPSNHLSNSKFSQWAKKSEKIDSSSSSASSDRSDHFLKSTLQVFATRSSSPKGAQFQQTVQRPLNPLLAKVETTNRLKDLLRSNEIDCGKQKLEDSNCEITLVKSQSIALDSDVFVMSNHSTSED